MGSSRSGRSVSSLLSEASVKKKRRAARRAVSRADITDQTRDELLTRINRQGSRTNRSASKEFQAVSSIVEQIEAGGDNQFARRENLRFRSELVRDRPGRRGLIFGNR